jgi:myo-inositol-1(or 4)-monophosphatase
LKDLIEIVKKAGAIALDYKARGLKHGLKGDGSSISDADLAVDQFLKHELLKLFPAGWLSEETADNADRLTAEYLWVVDPIDGTRSYIKGDTDWAVSVALLHHNQPIKAVLFRPDVGDLYVAERGEGATLNDVELIMKEAGEVIKITGPHPYLKPYLDKGMEASTKIHALALRIAAVSHGVIDLALASHNAHDWDIAAADLIVREAGGVLRYTSGAEIAYNQPSPRHATMIAGHIDTLKRI